MQVESAVLSGSWWKRNWPWLAGAGGALTLLGMIALFIVVVFSLLANSEAAKLALATAEANPVVLEKIGPPFATSRWVSGSINLNGSNGTAELSIPISGPKGHGSIETAARKTAGLWQISSLHLQMSDNSPWIDLLPAKLSPPSAADF